MEGRRLFCPHCGKPPDWRIHGLDTVAAFLDAEGIQGFFRRLLVARPGEFAVIVRNGRVEHVCTRERLSVGNFLHRIVKWFNLGPSIDILMVDASAFDLTFFVTARTADGQEIPSEFRLHVGVDQNNPALVLGAMRGRRALSRQDVYEAIRVDLEGKVLAPVVSRFNADDLRHLPKVSEEIRQSLIQVLDWVLADLGFRLLDASLSWGLSHEKLEEIARRKAEHEKALAETAAGQAKEERRRQHEYETIDLNYKAELAKQAALSAEEVADLEWDGETGRLRRRQQAELETAEKRAALAAKAERESAELALSLFERVQAAKRQREAQREDFQLQQMSLQQEAAQKILLEALGKGVADAATLQEFLRQQTLQKALDRPEGTSAAVSAAEGAAAGRAAFEEGRRAERGERQVVYQQAADLMRAAAAQGRAAVSCPACGRPADPAWIACPYCQARLGNRGGGPPRGDER